MPSFCEILDFFLPTLSSYLRSNKNKAENPSKYGITYAQSLYLFIRTQPSTSPTYRYVCGNIDMYICFYVWRSMRRKTPLSPNYSSCFVSFLSPDCWVFF